MCTGNQERDQASQRQPRKGGALKRNLDADSKPASKEINWSQWWPFDRATGAALEQLNRRQPKRNVMDEFEEALL